jgi:hypothetical protein
MGMLIIVFSDGADHVMPLDRESVENNAPVDV